MNFEDFLEEFYSGLLESQNSRGKKAYIMFHGTTLQAALNIIQHGFQRSTGGMLGPGIYVSRSFQKASAYPKKLQLGQQKVVLKLRVQVGRVKRIDYQGHPLQKSWHQAGYDTAWVPPNCGMVPSGLEEDCVWDPRNIDVLDILDSYGIPMNLSLGVMPGPFGILYPTSCPVPVPPMFVPPVPPMFVPPVRPMFGLPCPPPLPNPCGFPYPPVMRPPFFFP